MSAIQCGATRHEGGGGPQSRHPRRRTCLNVGCIPSKALLHASELFEEAGHSFAKIGIAVGTPKLDLAAHEAYKDKVVGELTKGVEFLLKKNKVRSHQRRGRKSPRPAK